MPKPTKNVLSNWYLIARGEHFIVWGTALVDQPSAGVTAGDRLRTSNVKLIRAGEDGTKVLETENSLYILI